MAEPVYMRLRVVCVEVRTQATFFNQLMNVENFVKICQAIIGDHFDIESLGVHAKNYLTSPKLVKYIWDINVRGNVKIRVKINTEILSCF